MDIDKLINREFLRIDYEEKLQTLEEKKSNALEVAT